MKLTELSEGYAAQAELLRSRLADLQERRKTAVSHEACSLDRRIRLLYVMYREQSDLAAHTKNYYTKGWYRSASYSFNP